MGTFYLREQRLLRINGNFPPFTDMYWLYGRCFHRWMMHDPVEFPNPETFEPERFMPILGKKPRLDPNQVVFGFGRRYESLSFIVFLEFQQIKFKTESARES